MSPNDGVQKRSGGGIERKRTVPLWGPLTLVVVVAVGSLLVMQVQTLPDPLPESAQGPLPERGTAVDAELAAAGEELFRIYCSACHKGADSRAPAVGPSLAGVTGRRPYPWIRGMVLEPDSMHRDDPIARRLLMEWRVPMRDVGMSEAGFRAVLEYLRLSDRPPDAGERPRRFGPAPMRAPISPDSAPAPTGESRPASAPTADAPAPVGVDTVGGSRLDPEAVQPPPSPPPDTLGAPRR